MKIALNAVTFQWGLLVAIIILIAVTGAGFYYASDFLKSAATETSHAHTNAAIALQNASRLRMLETELESKKEVVERAQQIVAESQQYQYQDQIVRDINEYASRNRVSIIGFSFESESATTPAPPGARSTEIQGVKIINATITLTNPVNYNDFLRFLKSIEQNLTKMQITGINMSPDNSNLANITSPTIGLQVYTRQ